MDTTVDDVLSVSQVLHETFPQHTFLMNGLIHGVKVIRFRSETVAAFIAVVGILSIVAQTVVLGILMRSIANKNTILLGLGFQILQLAWYGFGSQPWMMWAAVAVAAMSSITFPAISAILSRNADSDQQDVVQGMITGIRGLCNGLGPAFYGFIFYLFHMELTDLDAVDSPGKEPKPKMANPTDEIQMTTCTCPEG
ncbi:hippocampus abundant transcript 1 protein-like isoform X2 [Oncorhynchus keta]|uniref:hippocampus abundant transcript 1 protein-like isoform X2 n=1 Tax=Oncorhynchus keta TaxID=8018 RepID=UPI0015FB1293|nr:hippocampus abundant transcript 1 protein-like isoform X2 [Oncorhynchus keta]